jgi:hypothetical protein
VKICLFAKLPKNLNASKEQAGFWRREIIIYSNLEYYKIEYIIYYKVCQYEKDHLL